jgi:hypothetical protein
MCNEEGAMTISIDEMVREATAVKSCFQGKQEEREAIRLLGALYLEGLTLSEQVVHGQKISLSSPITPVVITLADVVALDTMHDNLPLHRSLCKTYRLFVEILWHQRLEIPNSVIRDEVKVKLINCAEKAELHFTATKQHDIAFEYKTARAAAVVLKSSESLWKKVFKAPQGTTPWAFIQTCQKLRTLFVENTTDSAYFDIHALRWLSACTRTKIVFNERISSDEVESCHSKGKEAAVNLVMICRDILLNPEAQDVELIKQVVDLLRQISCWAKTARGGGLSHVREILNPLYEQASSLAEQFLRDNHAVIQEKRGILPRGALSSNAAASSQTAAERDKIESLLVDLIVAPSPIVLENLTLNVKNLTQKQCDTLKERLPPFFNACPRPLPDPLSALSKRLALALAEWHCQRVATQESIFDTLRMCQQALSYFACAQQLTAERMSSLLFALIHRHYIENNALKDLFRFSLANETPERADKILGRLDTLSEMCSTQEDYDLLRKAYKELQSLAAEGGIPPAFHPLLRRIKERLDAPFRAPESSFLQTYQDKWSRFLASYRSPSDPTKSLATEEFLSIARWLLDRAISLIGDPPCSYAVMFKGPVAWQPVTPNAPLQLLFVTEEEYAAEYFTLLGDTLKFLTVEGVSTPLDFLKPPPMLRLGSTDVLSLPLTAEHESIYLPFLFFNKVLHSSRPAFLSTICAPEQKRKGIQPSFKACAQIDSCHSNLQKLDALSQLCLDLGVRAGLDVGSPFDAIQGLCTKQWLHPDACNLLTDALAGLYRPPSASEEELWQRLLFEPLALSIRDLLEAVTATPEEFDARVTSLFSAYNPLALALKKSLDTLEEETLEPSAVEPLIRALASIPTKTPADYYHMLSTVDLPGDCLRALYLDTLETRHSVQELLSLPTPKGVRQATCRDEARLLETLRSFTTSQATPVSLTIPSGETLYLIPDAMEQLLDASGNIRHAYEGSNHHVCALTGPQGGLHFKQKPTHPLMEYAIHSLTSRIADSPLTPASLLVRFEDSRSGTTVRYPVLLSQTVPGVILKTLAAPLNALSPQARRQWTWALLCTLLTKPADGRPDNYILTEDHRVICIDNDIAFAEPLLKKGLFTEIQFRSALFFALSDAVSLDDEVLQSFSRLNPHALLEGWIEDVLDREKQYLKLFDEDERSLLYKEDPDNRFKPTLLIQEGALSTLGMQFYYLQTYLADLLAHEASRSPLGLLNSLVSLRSEGTLNAVGKKIHAKYAKAAQVPFRERLKTALQSDFTHSLKTPLSDTACLGAVPTLDEIEKKRTYALETAQVELFSLFLHQYPGFVACGEERRGRFVQGSFKDIPPEKHSLILNAYTHFFHLPNKPKPTHIILQACAALNGKRLKPLLHDQLQSLDISYSPHITGKDVEMICNACPQLKELNLSHCPELDYVAKHNTLSQDDPLIFTHLEKLTLSSCAKLTLLKIRAPLDTLIAHDSPLKTIELPDLPQHTDLTLSLLRKTMGRGALKLLYAKMGRDALKRLEGERADVFGVVDWNWFFGDVGEVPPLPSNIQAILQGPCPLFPGKTVQDTHLLVLIPQTVNGAPFTLNMLRDLVKAPQRGGIPTQIDVQGSWKEALDKYGPTPARTSHWVLMSKRVLTGSSGGMDYQTQWKLVAGRGFYYEVPLLLDAVTCVLLERVRTGTFLYADTPWVYVQEDIDNRRLVVGAFAASGLRVVVSDYGGDFPRAGIGVAALRKF